MIDLLKSKRIDTSLLCELATHPDFVKLLADILSQNAYSGMTEKRFIDSRRSSITISKRIEGQDK